MAMPNYTDIMPAGKIHELQISDKEMYAFEPLLTDSIWAYTQRIFDLRKKLAIPSDYPNTLEMLVEIQELEGKISILKDLLQQVGLGDNL